MASFKANIGLPVGLHDAMGQMLRAVFICRDEIASKDVGSVLTYVQTKIEEALPSKSMLLLKKAAEQTGTEGSLPAPVLEIFSTEQELQDALLLRPRYLLLLLGEIATRNISPALGACCFAFSWLPCARWAAILSRPGGTTRPRGA